MLLGCAVYERSPGNEDTEAWSEELPRLRGIVDACVEDQVL